MKAGEVGSDQQVGQWIGRYQILGFLARGSMGEVFRGYDPQLDRLVAIKRLHNAEQRSDRAEWIRSEAKLHGRLTHPNVVQVFDFVSTDLGEPGSADHIVTELVEGQSLRSLLHAEGVRTKSGPALGLERGLDIYLAVTRGLSAAHQQQIVHRDLKSENVLIATDGAIKITDFGLSKLATGVGDSHAEEGMLVGSFHSMSPEQSLGAEVDERTDLFALGILAYEILANVSPFEGKTAEETLANVRARKAPPLKELVDAVPAELSDLVSQLLEKKRELRPRSAVEVERHLEGIVQRHRGRATRAGERVERQVAMVHLSIPVPEGAIDYAASDHLRFHELVRMATGQQEAELVSAAGDEVVLCVGYPRSHDNNADRAVRLVSSLVHDPSLSRAARADLRAGIDVGRVTIHSMGSGRPLILGAAVDRCRALGRSASAASVVVSETARSLLARFYRLDRRPAALGSADPTYEIAEELDASRVGEHTGEPPLVGRAQELELLMHEQRSFLEQASHGRVVTIEGEAGIGKSRLLRAFLEKSSRPDVRVLVAYATPADRHTAFAPVRRLLRALPELRRADGASPTRDEVVRWIRPVGVVDDEIVAAVAHVLSVADSGDLEIVRSLVDWRGSSAIVRLVAAFILQLAQAHPTTFVLEDIHFADSATRGVLDELVARAANHPLFVLVTQRPEGADAWLVTSKLDGSPPASIFRLERLGAADSQAIVRNTGQMDLSATLTSEIVSRAEGVPLVLEELTRHVLGRQPDMSALDTGVPTSLQDSIQGRLQALGAARKTAEAASVFGREAPIELLSMIAGRTVAEMDADLEVLGRANLVREIGFRSRGLTFHHQLVRDSIYGAIERRERNALHLRVIDALLPSDPSPDTLAHHYEAAQDYARAIEHYRVAGERAASRLSHVDACRHFERALELLVRAATPSGKRVANDEERRIRECLGPSLIPTRGLGAKEIETNNARLEELSADGAGAPRAWTDLFQQWAEAYVQCDTRRIAAALGSLDACASSPDPAIEPFLPLIRYLMHCCRGITLVHLGELNGAHAELATAMALRVVVLAILQTFPEHTIIVAPGAYMAWTQLLSGDKSGAVQSMKAEQDAYPPGSATQLCAYAQAAVLGAVSGDYEVAQACARAVIEGATSVVFNPGHVDYARFCDRIATLQMDLRDPTKLPSDALDALEASWTHFQGWRNNGRLVATSIIHCALMANAAVDVARHPAATPAVTEAAKVHAQRALDWGKDCLSSEGPAAMHRYFSPELFRAQARLFQLAGQPVRGRSALAEARRRCAQIDALGSAGPVFLLERIAESDEAIMEPRA